MIKCIFCASRFTVWNLSSIVCQLPKVSCLLATMAVVGVLRALHNSKSYLSSFYSVKYLFGRGSQPLEQAPKCLSSQSKYYSIKSERREKARQKKLVYKILRVDHAKELGADRIYAGQLAVLKSTEYGPVIQVIQEDLIYSK